MKTARFKQLVERLGRPEIKLLWGPPEKDRELQTAIRSGRLLTVHQPNAGSKKDWGVVGFWPEPLAQYLVFPASLRPFAERRIVGIDYRLIAEPPPGRVRAKRETDARRSSAKSATQPRPAPSRAKAPPGAKPPGAKVLPRNSTAAAPPEPPPRPPRQIRRAQASLPAESGTERAVPPPPPPVRPPSHALERSDVLRELERAVEALQGGRVAPALRRLEHLTAALKGGALEEA